MIENSFKTSLTACNYSYMQLGLMDYNARFYSPALGRFIQPDSIIPDLTNSQAWNRYSYVLNSPLTYIDPSGHDPCMDGDCSLNPEDLLQPEDNSDELVSYWPSNIPSPPDNISLDFDLASVLTPERMFALYMIDPLHGDPSDYSSFGGCNTLTQYCRDGHHAAIDAPGREGAPIYAIGYGTVVFMGNGEWGNYIVAEHVVMGETFYSIYAHLSGFAAGIQVGSVVDSSTELGGMGKTGCLGCNVHLHFEVRKSGGLSVAPGGSSISLHGAGFHTTAPSDAYWPYRKKDLAMFWVNLSLATWVDYHPNYFENNCNTNRNAEGCWPYD